MAKAKSINQPKKVYKNSECDFCNDWEKPLKLKKHPLNGKEYIFCKSCYGEFYKKGQMN